MKSFLIFLVFVSGVVAQVPFPWPGGNPNAAPEPMYKQAPGVVATDVRQMGRYIVAEFYPATELQNVTFHIEVVTEKSTIKGGDVYGVLPAGKPVTIWNGELPVFLFAIGEAKFRIVMQHAGEEQVAEAIVNLGGGMSRGLSFKVEVDRGREIRLLGSFGAQPVIWYEGMGIVPPDLFEWSGGLITVFSRANTHTGRIAVCSAGQCNTVRLPSAEVVWK